MATFSDTETRLRRYLRDPDAEVWSQDVLIQLFNEAQHTFNKDTSVLEKVVGMHVPQNTDYTRCYLWEEDYVSGAIRRCGQYYDATEYLCLYTWEVAQIRGYTPDATDGYRSCYSWEIYTLSEVVEDVDVYKLPYDYDTTTYMAFDREPLLPIDEVDLMHGDSSYRTHSGGPVFYYRIGQDEDREFAMYPRPDTVEIQSVVDFANDVDCGYTFVWEATYEHFGPESISTGKWSQTEGDYEAVYSWEQEFASGNIAPGPEYDFSGYYLTNNWDVTLMEHYEGMIVGVTPDDNTIIGEEGVIYRMDSALFDYEYGIPVDYVDMDNNITLLYKPRATDILSSDDDIENWLDWQVKYIERLAVSLALRINNDRYSPEQSDFWLARYRGGLDVIRRYKGRRGVGRRPALKTCGSTRNITRLVDLPDTYPSAWR